MRRGVGINGTGRILFNFFYELGLRRFTAVRSYPHAASRLQTLRAKKGSQDKLDKLLFKPKLPLVKTFPRSNRSSYAKISRTDLFRRSYTARSPSPVNPPGTVTIRTIYIPIATVLVGAMATALLNTNEASEVLNNIMNFLTRRVDINEKRTEELYNALNRADVKEVASLVEKFKKEGYLHILDSKDCDHRSVLMLLLRDSADRGTKCIDSNEMLRIREITKILIGTKSVDLNYKFLNYEETPPNGKTNNDPIEGGDTILHVAAKIEDSDFSCEIVEILLKDKNIDINATNAEGATSLMEAAFFGNSRVVDLLLRKGADRKIQNRNGQNALTISCARLYPDVVETILSYGTKDATKNLVNTRSDKSGQTALYCATKQGMGKDSSQLSVSKKDKEAVKIVRMLLAAGAEVNERNTTHSRTALHNVAEYNMPKTLDMILEYSKVDVFAEKDYGQTALMLSTDSVIMAKLENEMKKRRSPNKSTFLELYNHLKQGNYNEFEKKISQNPAFINIVNEEGLTLFHSFIKDDDRNIEVIKYLARIKGILVNTSDGKDGASPLHDVVKFDDMEMLDVLMEIPLVNVNIADRCGQTPLYLACRNRQVDCVKKLLNFKLIDINRATNDEYTPLLAAVWRPNNQEIVELLLSCEALQINIKGNEGVTAISKAVERGDVRIVELLLNQRGKDRLIDIDEPIGRTDMRLVDIAADNMDFEMIELLVNNKATVLKTKNCRKLTIDYLDKDQVVAYSKIRSYLLNVMEKAKNSNDNDAGLIEEGDLNQPSSRSSRPQG